CATDALGSGIDYW
nr:immunoglobulin heavy chain junction region [Macaca mulatta]MOV36689.1 immunoglobulin heavy chain junction region [Macaca mulatta]